MLDEVVELTLQNDIDSLVQIDRDRISKGIIYDISELFDFDNIKTSTFVLPANGLSLLHIAAFSNSFEVFLYLIYNLEFDILSESKDGYMPLHYAILGNSSEITSFILTNYENLTGKNIHDIFEKDYEQKSEIILPYLAIAARSIDELNILENNSYKLENLKNLNEAVNKLINLSLTVDSFECLEWVLRNSRSIGTADMLSLNLAISLDMDEAFEKLLEQNEKNNIDSLLQTALSYACFKRKTKLVRSLVNRIQCVDIFQNTNAKSAVHWICQSKSLEIAKLMLIKEVDVNRFDNYNRVGPYYLVDCDNDDECLEILKMLVNHGFDINRHHDNQKTLLAEFVTSIRKSPVFIDYLVSNGANLESFVNDKMTIKEYMTQISSRNASIRKIISQHPERFQS